MQASRVPRDRPASRGSAGDRGFPARSLTAYHHGEVSALCGQTKKTVDAWKFGVTGQRDRSIFPNERGSI